MRGAVKKSGHGAADFAAYMRSASKDLCRAHTHALSVRTTRAIGAASECDERTDPTCRTRRGGVIVLSWSCAEEKRAKAGRGRDASKAGGGGALSKEASLGTARRGVGRARKLLMKQRASRLGSTEGAVRARARERARACEHGRACVRGRALSSRSMLRFLLPPSLWPEMIGSTCPERTAQRGACGARVPSRSGKRPCALTERRTGCSTQCQIK
eukprot:5675878-Pleurochrysis_carterae.AAC.1